jgi:hypothetical protein
VIDLKIYLVIYLVIYPAIYLVIATLGRRIVKQIAR